MLLYKKEIKPVIKSYCLLWVYEQTGMSFRLLANIKLHLYLVSQLQTQPVAVGTCMFQCVSTKPSGTTSELRSCQSTAKLHFWRRKAISIKVGERILNESCPQPFIYCKTRKTWELTLRLWGFCLQKNEVLDHAVLHFWCCIFVRDQNLIITPPFMGNALQYQV